MTEITNDELREQIKAQEVSLFNIKLMLDSTEKSIPLLKADISIIEKNIEDLSMVLRLRTPHVDEPAQMKELCPEG